MEGWPPARTIAAIFTHMHNVRSKWVRLTAPHLKVPPQLNRAQCTPLQACAGLAESAARCAQMLAEALGGDGRVEKFRRDGWAAPWAGWPGNAVLHAFSRSPPSRAGVYARASARIPVAQGGGVRDLELGKAVERVRVVWRPRLRFLRNRARGTGRPGDRLLVKTSSPRRWGCCGSSGANRESARISSHATAWWIYGKTNAINESPRLGSNSWLPPVAATTTYCFPFLP
jgi:hypothetical protein